MNRPASFVATIFLSLISVAQLVRFLFGFHVTAEGLTIPVWISFPAFLFTGGLAFWLWKERKKM